MQSQKVWINRLSRKKLNFFAPRPTKLKDTNLWTSLLTTNYYQSGNRRCLLGWCQHGTRLRPERALKVCHLECQPKYPAWTTEAQKLKPQTAPSRFEGSRPEQEGALTSRTFLISRKFTHRIPFAPNDLLYQAGMLQKIGKRPKKVCSTKIGSTFYFQKLFWTPCKRCYSGMCAWLAS